jgi:hypothetical protein
VARLRRPMTPMISPSFIDNSFAFLDERVTVQSVIASFVALILKSEQVHQHKPLLIFILHIQTFIYIHTFIQKHIQLSTYILLGHFRID